MAYLSTKEAAAVVGLSPQELRRGYKAGIYPGLAVGERGGKLRFDPDHVINAIRERSGEAAWQQQKVKG